MSSPEELQDSLESFARSCNENTRLQSIIKDWNRNIHIRAQDLGKDMSLRTDQGSVTVSSGPPAAPDLVIQSTGEVLAQIFYGELSPNDPYNDGRLRIQGPESDIVRLDFIIAMLWE